jgi:hypothetical protein
MGSRVGYRVRCAKGAQNELIGEKVVSPILRQQWIGGIKLGVKKMWETLGGKPGDGGQALRGDLDISRGFAAMVYDL